MVARKRTVKKTTAKKASNRKPAARKITAKKTTTRKFVAKKPTLNRNTIKTAWTKSQILSGIADHVDLTRKQVACVFDELSEIIAQHVKKGGAGEFTIPGLAKIMTKNKPATKARKGVNPFTGEEMMFKAKPAKTIIKIRALKKLKDYVA
jgi:nucleoid DNA-binding protein